RPASRSARPSSGPGRRARPEILNVSSSYPAAGTSVASARSGDPANVTRTPRARSASATASAGRTCPAVPPAAIRHLSSRCTGMATGDVKEDAHRRELDDEARATVRDERQRDPGQGREPEDGGQVDHGLPADEGGEPGRETLSERIAAGQG